MPGRKRKSKAAVAKAAVLDTEEASFHLLDEWLRIEMEHTDPGFILPDRAAVVAWSEQHAVPVLLFASLAVWGPVISAICFG